MIHILPSANGGQAVVEATANVHVIPAGSVLSEIGSALIGAALSQYFLAA